MPFSALNTDLRGYILTWDMYMCVCIYVCMFSQLFRVVFFNISCNSNQISHTQDTAVLYSYYMIDLFWKRKDSKWRSALMNIIMLGIKNNIQLLLHISFAWLMTVYGVLQLQVKCWRGLKSQREPHLDRCFIKLLCSWSWIA